MAHVDRGFTLTLVAIDSGNNKSTLRFVFDIAVVIDFAGALAAAVGFVADFEAVSGALVGKWSVNNIWSDDGPVLPADEEVEDKASISFTMDNGKTGNLRIPAPVPLVFQGTTTELRNQVDITYAPVVTYFDNFRDVGPMFVSETDKLVQLVRGKRIHIKNSNG